MRNIAQVKLVSRLLSGYYTADTNAFDIEISYSNDLKGNEEIRMCSPIFTTGNGGALHYDCRFRGVDEFLAAFPDAGSDVFNNIQTADLERLYQSGNACLVCHAGELYGLNFYLSGDGLFYTDCYDRVYTLEKTFASLDQMVEFTRCSNPHEQFLEEEELVAYLQEYSLLKTEDGATVQFLPAHEKKPAEIYVNRVLKVYNNHDGMDVAASASLSVADFIKSFEIYQLKDLMKKKSHQLLRLYEAGKAVIRYGIFYGDYELEFRKKGDATIIREKESLRLMLGQGREEDKDRELYVRWIENFEETEDNFLEQMHTYLEIINPRPATRMDVPIEQLFNQKTAVNPEIFFR